MTSRQTPKRLSDIQALRFFAALALIIPAIGFVPVPRLGIEVSSCDTFTPIARAAVVRDTEQAAKAIVSGELRVTFFGDSITEGISDVSSYDASWAGITTRCLRDMIPDTKVVASNLSISGRGISEARSPNYVGGDGSAGTFGPRSAPHPDLWPEGIAPGVSWYEHVRASRPDILFIAFGMNTGPAGDAVSFAARLREAIDWTAYWPVKPTIVVVTPMLPTHSAESPASPPSYVQAMADAARFVSIEKQVNLADANSLYWAWRSADIDEDRILGTRRTTPGAGINHPTDWAHQHIYYASVAPVLQAVIESASTLIPAQWR